MPAITGTIIAGVGAAAALAGTGVKIAEGVDKGNREGAAAKSQASAAEQQQANYQQSLASAQAGAANLQPEVDAQKNLASQLAAQGGIKNQSNVYDQFQGIVAGTGPNPAQAMLANQTGANNANQAAMMAGQRGAGANAGLIARQAAQQGAANQQNAIGQGAALQANQSLSALGQAGNIAGQQVGNQMQGQGAATQAVMNQQQMAQGLAISQGANANNATGNLNNANKNFSGGTGIGETIGGAGKVLGEAGAVASNMFPKAPVDEPFVADAQQQNAGFAHGGSVGPKSYVAHHFMGGTAKPTDGKEKLRLALGGKVPAMVSPGEIYLPPTQAAAVAQGVASPMQGEVIPGKAKVKGDSLKNDTVPKTLEEGGVVIPRSVLDGPNAHREAYKFVNAALGKAAMKRKSK